MLIRKLAVGLALSVVALVTVVPGTGHADALQNIKDSGKVRIAIDPAAPPYSAVNEQGDYAGFEVEVEVAKRLASDWGVTLQIVPSTPANRIPYLITGQAHLVVSTLSITDERKQVIDFSRPYSGIQIVVGAPETAGIASLEDLVGKRVAVTRGSTNDDEITKDALPGTNILRFEDDATSITALLSGQAEAYVTAPALFTSIRAKSPEMNMEPRIVLKTNLTGIGLPKGEDSLRDALDQWVADRLADGTLARLYHDQFQLELPEEVFQAGGS
ncbi:transporter substrate-binding domain-containing protein (plasmid) [Paracoccus sp. TD-10]|uniref:transporter substrate-binding domain-containing protein n=1 Tax=Paracoccus sp. TD-10 TaxID=3395918 RepID=UPI003AAF8669